MARRRGANSLMATGLLAVIDDIATLLDDVAVLTKVATKKTAGGWATTGAERAAGLRGTGRARAASGVGGGQGARSSTSSSWFRQRSPSAPAPWAITPLLMAGGAFLCFEGVEKLAHKFLHSKDEEDAAHARHLQRR